MKLKINESKTFEFSMDTSGVNWKDLNGSFRLTLNDVEYGFPVKVEEGIVSVTIPVFKDVLNEGVKASLYNSKEITVDAKLELIANNEVYLKPWEGTVDIEIPVTVKLSEEKVVEKDAKVKVTDPDVKDYLEEEKKRKKKTKLMESLKSLEKKEPKLDKEEVEVEEKHKEPEKKKTRFSSMLDD